MRLESLSEQEVSSLPLCIESDYLNPAKTCLTEKIKASVCDSKPPKIGDLAALLGRLLWWLIHTTGKNPQYSGHIYIYISNAILVAPFSAGLYSSGKVFVRDMQITSFCSVEGDGLVTGSRMRTRTAGRSRQETLLLGEAVGSFPVVSKLLISIVSVWKDVVVVTAPLYWPRCCSGLD